MALEHLQPVARTNDDAGPYPGGEYVANDKDEVEHQAWEDVCDRQVRLSRVQTAMATNWTRLTDQP